MAKAQMMKAVLSKNPKGALPSRLKEAYAKQYPSSSRSGGMQAAASRRLKKIPEPGDRQPSRQPPPRPSQHKQPAPNPKQELMERVQKFKKNSPRVRGARPGY